MLSIERIGRTVVATLSRPPVNALDDALIARLDAVLDQVAGDTQLALLHIRSDQPVFCAGADLAFMQRCLATPEGPDRMVELVRRMQQLFERLETARVVTLAEMGAALGADWSSRSPATCVAAAEAKLGLPSPPGARSRRWRRNG
jgi:enoyl-CoA hydratase/carnithine racemase